MKFIVALACILALAQANILPREKFQAKLIPRDIEIPEDQLFPRYTGAEWTEILANQAQSKEIVDNYKPGTEDPHPNAGKGGDGKIIGGAAASSGQFPWQVAVSMDSSYFCGGSIISLTVVLTAAHCTDDITSFTMQFGTLNNGGGGSGSVARTSRDRVQHSGYGSLTIANDISIIKLGTALVASSTISPVRLPSRSQQDNLFVGVNARVSGWGKTADVGGISPTLQWVDLPVITNAVCANTYGSTVRASNICCSGANRKSTCNGDSGGPLCVQESNGLWTEVGVVSFGSSAGCTLGYPVAFTRVTSYLDWIQTNAGITIQP